MRQFTVFTILSVFFLSVPVVPLPFGHLLEKRGSGEATWYHPGLGACGQTNTDSNMVVALSPDDYGTGQYCGKSITVTNPANGATVTVTVADECTGCDDQHIDLSEGAFSMIGNTDAGVLNVNWEFT